MPLAHARHRRMLPRLAAFGVVLLTACYMPEDASFAGGDAAPNDGPTTTPQEMPQRVPESAATCDTTARVPLYLSPDDSNSMSSPVQAREAAFGTFSSLSAVPIRPWEFFNYYDFDYPPAEPGTVNVTPELMATSTAGEYILQIGVSSATMSEASRPPVNLTLVLDTSGSMSGHSMDMLKATGFAIAASLREGDTVSMVTWNTSNAEVLASHIVQQPNDPILLSAIQALEASGGTDLHGGLVAGYDLAQRVYDKARINRLLLVSDGGANVGVTDIELIGSHADANDEDGIYLIGVGVGDSSTYHDDLMDAVTDAGKGASVFIASEDEARRMFHRDFIKTTEIAARNVQLQLDLPPGFSIVKFSGEEYSTDPAEIEPQHLAPNDSMVFHQRIATCDPQSVVDDMPLGVTVAFQDGRTRQPHQVSVTIPFGARLRAPSARMHKGVAVSAYADALKEIRDSGPRADELLAQARADLETATSVSPGDPDLGEMLSVLDAL